MMVKIEKAIPLPNYALKITFSTGESGIFEMIKWLDGPIFSKLKEPEIFTHVAIDEVAKTICWPNGIDMCPDVVYQHTKMLNPTVN